jgi:hypothetical protein
MTTLRSQGPRGGLASFLFAGLLVVSAGWDPARASDETVAPYAAKPEDFRPEYDRDRVNKRVQTWNQYWRWVAGFYKGNAFSEGWTKEVERTVATVNAPIRQELTKTLNDVGKRIAGEWAKDNGVRKISTDDLRRWRAALDTARGRKDKTGKTLKATLSEIQKEISRKMKDRP